MMRSRICMYIYLVKRLVLFVGLFALLCGACAGGRGRVGTGGGGGGASGGKGAQKGGGDCLLGVAAKKTTMLMMKKKRRRVAAGKTATEGGQHYDLIGMGREENWADCRLEREVVVAVCVLGGGFVG